MKPFLIDGIVTDNWEPYYDNLQKEISELFGDILLDENGEASNGSHLDEYYQNICKKNVKVNKITSDGGYPINYYRFYYDWRLDPCYIADQFNDYIQTLKQTTGSEKVSIVCRCIGSNVVCAWLQKYGTSDLYGIGFDGITCNGAEPISEAMSGKFTLDSYAIQRIFEDGEAFGFISFDDFVNSTIDLAVSSGLPDYVSLAMKKTIYDKIAKGVTSALTLASCSYPSYWACVKVEDFDSALEYVFGDEGSEKRIKYQGMIEKITYYNENVKKNIPTIMENLKDKVNVGCIAKYGTQILPICQSKDKISDTFVSLNSSSFGATTSTIYDTLPDSYINSQIEKGLGKYISPDKQVDTSTCIFRDSTWILKGARHSYWTDFENALLYTVVTADHQMSIEEMGISRYLVHPSSDNIDDFIPMTEENCNVENWNAQEQIDEQETKLSKLFAFVKSLIQWINQFYTKYQEKITSIISDLSIKDRLAIFDKEE